MSKPIKLGADYAIVDISDEDYREVVTASGVYRIDAPRQLVMRTGGKTHRVLDAAGVVHCYPAPETGLSVIRWKPRPGKAPVRF